MVSILSIVPKLHYSETGGTLLSIVKVWPEAELNTMHPGNTLERLGNFRLPEFQRPPVWNDEQNRRLIESIWKGIPIGSYSINRSENKDLDDLLLDGQQRVRAILGYVNDEYPVFGHYYSEVDIADRRTFQVSKFSCHMTTFDNMEEIKDYYDTLNFGGVAHTNEQRATMGYVRPGLER